MGITTKMRSAKKCTTCGVHLTKLTTKLRHPWREKYCFVHNIKGEKNKFKAFKDHVSILVRIERHDSWHTIKSRIVYAVYLEANKNKSETSRILKTSPANVRFHLKKIENKMREEK